MLLVKQLHGGVAKLTLAGPFRFIILVTAMITVELAWVDMIPACTFHVTMLATLLTVLG